MEGLELNYMNTKIFYYSSTGNSLYVGERISNFLEDCELIPMTQALNSSEFQYNCEKAIFIYPVHCFGLPIIAFNFIKQIHLTNCNYIYCVAVSGGGEGIGSFKQINHLLQNYGHVTNFSTIKYVSNYIKAGRRATPERVAKCDKENELVIDNIIEDIKSQSTSSIYLPKSKGSLSNRAWRKFFRGKNNKFTVNDSCINCKVCEKICPVSNIKIETDKPVWSNNCVDCMGCINLCPKEAINLGTKTSNKPRYKNKHIPTSKLFIK